MFKPTPNLPLLRRVLAQIDAHPEEWDQESWFSRGWWARRSRRGDLTTSSCGTAACVAGWACLLAGDTPDWTELNDEFTSEVVTTDGRSINAAERARELLGLTPDEGRDLFANYNCRTNIQRAAEDIAARAGERL